VRRGQNIWFDLTFSVRERDEKMITQKFGSRERFLVSGGGVG
jgi:hypothetical protein